MVFLTHILPFSCSIATAMQRKKAFIWLQGGAYKNNPAGYFSERASWRRVNFSLQSKKFKRVHCQIE
jgi:hypothetical protein